jgi:hypothetical protein
MKMVSLTFSDTGNNLVRVGRTGSEQAVSRSVYSAADKVISLSHTEFLNLLTERVTALVCLRRTQ